MCTRGMTDPMDRKRCDAYRWMVRNRIKPLSHRDGWDDVHSDRHPWQAPQPTRSIFTKVVDKRK
jgi:hypothetical protein